MSVNDDMMQGSNESFFEPGKYMRTVKRCDNGYKLCDSLRQLIESRSEIEKKYSSMLTAWAKKWNEFLDKGPEYGTCEGAWRGVLAEADSVAELHTDMGDRLLSEAYTSIKQWQKENYHKSMMHFKETKEFDDGFRKAQKPWGKRLGKVMTAKKEYHTACRTEKSLANQENNARGDNSVAPDGLKKLQDKLRKCQQEVEAARDKYQACLNDLNGYNAKYVEDMTEVYDRCQLFEQKRIEFFKKTLFDIHKCLDLSVDARYSQVYTALHGTIGRTDSVKDLKWWSTTHGTDMPMAWPQFEEYSPELQAISRRGKGSVNTGDGGIVVTGIRPVEEGTNGSNDYSTVQRQSSRPTTVNAASTSSRPTSSSTSSYDQSLNPFGEDEEDKGDHSFKTQAPEISETNGSGAVQGSNGAENPFGDGDLDEEEGEDLDDGGSQGWACRALYDYEKSEEDEIGFRAGEVFVQLTAEDEMGWCKGRKDGMVGLFPANYVERI